MSGSQLVFDHMRRLPRRRLEMYIQTKASSECEGKRPAGPWCSSLAREKSSHPLGQLLGGICRERGHKIRRRASKSCSHLGFVLERTLIVLSNCIIRNGLKGRSGSGIHCRKPQRIENLRSKPLRRAPLDSISKTRGLMANRRTGHSVTKQPLSDLESRRASFFLPETKRRPHQPATVTLLPTPPLPHSRPPRPTLPLNSSLRRLRGI